MAIGDEAQAAGYPIVPNTGEEGKVRYGAREINRTRDFLAELKTGIPEGVSGFQVASGITYGTADPTGGNDGDIYFKIV